MKKKKKNSTILFLFPFVLSLSFILIRSLLFFVSLPYYLFLHSRKGRKALHDCVSLVSASEILRSCTSYMGDKEEKKPMATSSEILSWHRRNREIHISLGPWGTTNGSSWDDGFHQRIENILVSYSSSYICSIRTVYKDLNNEILIAPEHGSLSLANTFEEIDLPPETLITRIDGYYNTGGITCLELSTNNGKIGSFGIKSGSPFTYQVPRGFTGFHGRSNGYYITALGVYVNSSATKYK